MRHFTQPGIGKALRKYREGRRLTGRELADKSGVSQGHISELENGRKNFTSTLIERLAGGFDLETGAFLLEIENLVNESLGSESEIYQSARVMEPPAPYNVRTEAPDDMRILAEHLIADMSAEERAVYLRKLTEAAISGDEMASAAARAMLLLIRKFANA